MLILGLKGLISIEKTHESFTHIWQKNTQLTFFICLLVPVSALLNMLYFKYVAILVLLLKYPRYPLVLTRSIPPIPDFQRR